MAIVPAFGYLVLSLHVATSVFIPWWSLVTLWNLSWFSMDPLSIALLCVYFWNLWLDMRNAIFKLNVQPSRNMHASAKTTTCVRIAPSPLCSKVPSQEFVNCETIPRTQCFLTIWIQLQTECTKRRYKVCFRLVAPLYIHRLQLSWLGIWQQDSPCWIRKEGLWASLISLTDSVCRLPYWTEGHIVHFH